MADLFEHETRNRKLIVAHRGGAPWRENTVEAFRHAIACGADMIEFDVRRTGDGELIVHHDEAIGDRALAEIDYTEALRRSAGLGYRVPLLSDLLELSRGRILLDVELKEGGYEESVLRLIFDRRFRVSEFAVTSFDLPALERVRQASPGVARGLLVYDVTGPEALERFHQSGTDFLGPDYNLLDETTLNEAAASFVPLLPWTVNDAAAIRTLLRAPAVAGVITDRTVDALQIRNDEAARPSGPRS
jgi:glycerophosphoryl diester phosphodiesterase